MWRVSSAAIKEQVCNISRARGLKSPRLPIGVATTYSRPAALIVTIIGVRMVGFRGVQVMAAIARRPRLPLSAALAAALILSACSLLKPEQAAQERLAVARSG